MSGIVCYVLVLRADFVLKTFFPSVASFFWKMGDRVTFTTEQAVYKNINIVAEGQIAFDGLNGEPYDFQGSL